jgi:hypothetical protein
MGGAGARDLRASTINAKKHQRRVPWEVPELGIPERPPSLLRNIDGGIREHPPSTLRNIDSGPLGGVRARDPKAPTINVKARRWRAPWVAPDPRGGSGPHPGSKRCVVTCIVMIERKKVMLLMGPILPALSSVMPDDP